MAKYTDYLMWPLVSAAIIGLIVIIYPFFVLKNLKYHLRAPSVLVYSILFFILDRLTKILVQANTSHLPYQVVPNFFDLTFVKNPGVAFGWFPEWRLPPIIMAVVMIVIISYYSIQLPAKEKLTRWALALLVGGAIGNLYDRLVYGYVVDFFLFHFGGIDFPVFNVADIAIDCGVIFLFIDIFWMSSEEAEEGPTISPTVA